MSLENDLLSRFEDELDVAAFGDPAENLTYADRQQLKAGNHAALAREKLPELERAIWWSKAMSGLSGAMLALAALWFLLAYLDVASATTPLGEIGGVLFYVACMGLAALGGLWKLPALERRCLLCELVIAREEAASPVA